MGCKMIIVAITGFILILYGEKIRKTKNIKYINHLYKNEDFSNGNEYCNEIGKHIMHYGLLLIFWVIIYIPDIMSNLMYILLFIAINIFLIIRFVSIYKKYRK